MFADEAFLDQLIANQRRAIRYHLLFAAGMAVFGVAVATFAYLVLDPDQGITKNSLEIGGVFVTSLSAFPIKEVLQRRERLGVFNTIKQQMSSIKKDRDAGNAKTIKRIDELLWQVVEKISVGA